MRDGLKVIQVTGSYYGYAVTMVGWLRRVAGDEYELLAGARVVMRKSSVAPASLARLANDGMESNYFFVGEPSEGPEEINRLLVRRCFPANEKVWGKACPKPKDWGKESR